MQILEGLEGLRKLAPGGVVSVGNFDGVHRGHTRILQLGRQFTHAGAVLAVVTFEPHPLTVLRPDKVPPRLTPPAMKRELLAAAGVDALVVLPPTPEVLDLSAEAFWHLLRDEVRPAYMVEGPTFSFGKNRGGTVGLLRQWADASAVKLHVVDPVRVSLTNMNVVRVSSSLVRWLLDKGRVRDAAICLGRAYALEGEVVKGYQRGRTIGMPTANLNCGEQLIPADGVYAGRCTLEGRVLAAAVSIGTMPTFGENRRQVEAHLVGYAGDLYGRGLRVELLDWLREQWKFGGVEALKAQLVNDVEQTIARTGMEAGREMARVR